MRSFTRYVEQLRPRILWLSELYKDWSILGTEIMDTLTAIDIAEKEAFESLRGEVEYRCLLSKYSGVYSAEL